MGMGGMGVGVEVLVTGVGVGGVLVVVVGCGGPPRTSIAAAVSVTMGAAMGVVGGSIKIPGAALHSIPHVSQAAPDQLFAQVHSPKHSPEGLTPSAKREYL